MRVVAGKYKRKNLKTLESYDTRPTKDMVKEAIFDSIQINECDTFLDLFAGSGSIGIEAISRGASKVVFNDINNKAVNVIKENLKNINEVAEVYNKDSLALLNILNDSFSYIFIDPPYAYDRYDELIDTIINNKLLKDNGVIILEVHKDTIIKHESFKEKKYGISKIIYIK